MAEVFENLGLFGCKADVKSLISARCNGKQRCEIAIPDPDISASVSCEKGLPLYLDVTYVCTPQLEKLSACEVLHVDRSQIYVTTDQIMSSQCTSWTSSGSYLEIQARNNLFIRATFTLILEDGGNGLDFELGVLTDAEETYAVPIIIAAGKTEFHLEFNQSHAKILLHEGLVHQVLIGLQGENH